MSLAGCDRGRAGEMAQTVSLFKRASFATPSGRLGVPALLSTASGPYAHADSAAGYPNFVRCPRIQLALRPLPVRFGDSGELTTKALNQGLKRCGKAFAMQPESIVIV